MESILKKENFFKSILIFLIFSIFFSFNFNFNRFEKVYANPLVGIAESELAPIIVNILSSFGIVVSLPTARDFLEEEKEFCNQKALELQNHKGAVTKGIQALKEGFYVSKEFVTDVLDRWEDYCIKKNIKSERLANTITYSFPSAYKYYNYPRFVTIDKLDSYYNKIFSSSNIYIPSSASSFTISLRRSGSSYDYGYLDSYSRTISKKLKPSFFGTSLSLKVESQNFFVNAFECVSGVQSDTTGLKVSWGFFDTKPQVNKKVIDNTLNPVNEKNQGIVISPENVEAVGKVLNPTIPDVKGSSVDIDIPISDVASTVPNVESASDVGALDWGVPIDGSIDIPKDETKDTPKDETKDTPKDESIDFSPFLTLGSQLKSVFPFCVPFDFINQLKTLQAPPKVPRFEIDFGKTDFFKRNSINYVFVIDFSRYELIASIIRYFVLLTFIIFLILKTRILIKG